MGKWSKETSTARPTASEKNNGGYVPSEWQTRSRGRLEDEYEIYVKCAEDLGWEVKSFDEWLNS